MYRTPLNGRNFEYLGEDPYLAARMVGGFNTGVPSQGVSGTIKDYLGNESEFARNTSDSRIDEPTLREIYLPVWEAAVKEARVGAMMASYNLTNGDYMTANHHFLVAVLKLEGRFPALLLSHSAALHSP